MHRTSVSIGSTVASPSQITGEKPRIGILDARRPDVNSLRTSLLDGPDAATLERFLATPRVRVLKPHQQKTCLFGEVTALLRQAGIAIQQDDVWVAALCKQHGFALATRDQGFQYGLGLEVIDLATPAQTRGSQEPQGPS